MVYNSAANMATHDELVMEMATLEKMSVQERLKHARKRRAQQLKRYHQSDKEFTKRQRKNTNQMKEIQVRRNVTFAKNVELLEAAARGDLEEVKLLLENGVDPNIGNEDGLTALHQSCIDNNESMMRVLVEKGADVNVTDRELWTPLHAASTCGHRHLAQFLIGRGAQLLAINSDGNMPYDICEDEATLDYIESQMATQGITQEQIDELREILPNEMLEGMQQLYKDGGDLEHKDSVGATPLHIAVANGYDKVVQYLLSHNVDVAARDNDGWQPIHAAVCWAQADIITMLVESGADLDARTSNDDTPLSICEDEDIRTLIQQLKVEIQSNRIRPSGGLMRRHSSRKQRGSSIRRSSKKGEMRKLDAKGEAAFIHSRSEELENSSEVQVTNIDDVQVKEETNGHLEQTTTTTTSGDDNENKEEGGGENGEAGEGEGDEEGRVTPMPVITEELSDNPESPRGKKTNGDLSEGNGTAQENGRTDSGDFDEGGTHQKRLVSILKKRPDDHISGKPQKSKKEQKEEREKAKREQKEREKQEKQRQKTAKKKEKENRKGSNGGEGGEVGPGGDQTLSELKKKRASQQGNKSGATNAPESELDIAASPRPLTPSKQGGNKGPQARLRLPRPLTGRYDFHTGEEAGQNGDATPTDEGVGSAPDKEPEDNIKRFSGVAEAVGDDSGRSCCIIS